MARARYQPQGQVRLDGRNRFVPGATVFPLAASPISLGANPGVVTTTSGATATRGGTFGKAFATTAAGADFIRLGAIPQMTTAAFTVLVVVKLADLSGNPTIFESGSALTGLGSSNNSFQFRANSNGSLGAVKDNVADLGSSAAGAVAAGRYFVAAVSYGGGVMRIAVDGRSIYEVASNQTFSSGNFSLLTKDGTTSEKSAGEVALFAYWPRLMSTADMSELTGNSLQLFDVPHEEEFASDVGGDASISPDGVFASASVRMPGASAGARSAPVGVTASASAGAAASSAGSIAALPGVAAIARVGSVSAAGGSASTAAPNGVSATAAVAPLTAIGAAKTSPPGIAAQARPGAVTAAGSIAAPVSPFDISKIHPSRIAVFGGSGSRVGVFEGSGSRVSRFL